MPAKRTRTKSIGAETKLIKAVSHPLKIRALSILAERPASPKEIATELGEETGNVSYHVRELAKLKVIELVDEKKRRGAVEHFYRAVARPLLSDAEWDKLSPEERETISVYGLQLLVGDVARSLGEGVFDDRGDRHMSRTPLLVDEKGWSELTGIYERALSEVLEVQAASAGRMSGKDDEGTSVTASLLLFERPRGG